MVVDLWSILAVLAVIALVVFIVRRRPSMDRADLRAAYLVTAAWLLAGATADVALIRSERNPITHVLRTPPGIAFLLVFNLHVADVLGRYDPFRAAGHLIRKR